MSSSKLNKQSFLYIMIKISERNFTLRFDDSMSFLCYSNAQETLIIFIFSFLANHNELVNSGQRQKSEFFCLYVYVR